MKIVIAGGGTGGHLFPGIAIAEEVMSRSRLNEVLFIGTDKGIEARILPDMGWQVSFIAAEGIKGKGMIARLRGLMKVIPGIIQSIAILRRFKPGIVLGIGGYASAPVLLGAKLTGIRTFIQEQNVLPGFTNRSLGRIADRIFLSFPESARYFSEKKVILSGNPLRKEILKRLGSLSNNASDRPSLLIFGGSSGAHSINLAVIDMLKYLDPSWNLKIVHQTGERDVDYVRDAYRMSGRDADVRPFIYDMASAYNDADLVICRSGATTIAELAAAGKPSILIPYPYAADDHQRINAEALLKTGGALMILEKDLSGDVLAKEVSSAIGDRERLKSMSLNAKKASVLNAAEIIVDEIYKADPSSEEIMNV